MLTCPFNSWQRLCIKACSMACPPHASPWPPFSNACLPHSRHVSFALSAFEFDVLLPGVVLNTAIPRLLPAASSSGARSDVILLMADLCPPNSIMVFLMVLVLRLQIGYAAMSPVFSSRNTCSLIFVSTLWLDSLPSDPSLRNKVSVWTCSPNCDALILASPLLPLSRLALRSFIRERSHVSQSGCLGKV